jgi:predicted DNA-binding protein
MQRFSSEIEKFLGSLDSDIFKPFQTPKTASKRQPRRTVTLSAEMYERLKDYAARHGKSMSEVVNQKLNLSLSSVKDENEFDMIFAMHDATERGDRGCQYVN